MIAATLSDFIDQFKRKIDVDETAEVFDHSFDRVAAGDVEDGCQHAANQAVFGRDSDGCILRELLLQLLAATLLPGVTLAL